MAVLAMSATANAGSIYTWLVVDPPTTAGAGVAAVSGAGQNMVVNSSRTGVGSFHVYAVDDADNSSGLRSFFVKLNGTVSGVLNRSPLANYDTEPVYGDGAPSNVGFDSPRTATPILGGSQGPTNVPQVGGFGQTAGNFQAVTNAGSYQAAPTSGQWGNYAVGDGRTSGQLANGHIRNAILLGEGLYTGAAPTIDVTTAFDQNGTGFNFWNSTGFPLGGSGTVAVGTAQSLVNANPFVPEPATLTLIGLAIVGFGGFVGRRRS